MCPFSTLNKPDWAKKRAKIEIIERKGECSIKKACKCFVKVIAAARRIKGTKLKSNETIKYYILCHKSSFDIDFDLEYETLRT